MLNTDPPDHTRLRRLVSKAFTPSAIEALRPRIQELVDAALDEMAERGSGDVVGELAFPLPFDVISEMLGMPEADKQQIAAVVERRREDARPDDHRRRDPREPCAAERDGRPRRRGDRVEACATRPTTC